MIVLSFVLVVVAAVTLIIGLFQDTLAWIWTSIASCVVAMIFLGIGVLQRRRVAIPAEQPGYGPGVATGPAGSVRAAPTVPTAAEPVPGVPRSPSPAAWRPTQTTPTQPSPPMVTRRPAPAATVTGEESPAPAAEEPATETAEEPLPVGPRATKKTAAPPAAKRAVKKAVKKASARKAVRKAPARKAAKKTTGTAARLELARVRGVGPAKQEALLREFGSLEAIRAASVEELMRVRGIGAATARQLRGEP